MPNSEGEMKMAGDVSVPAAQIEPGVHWQRPEGVFPNEPSVERRYNLLLGRGEITLVFGHHETNSTAAQTQRETQEAARALVRRAAEDGYHAGVRHVALSRDAWGERVTLVGPLTPELAADPVPGWHSQAAELYTDLCEAGEIGLPAHYWSNSPLASTSRGVYIEQELRALAARDGYELDCDWYEEDGIFCVIKLQGVEETPTAEGEN